MKQQLIIVMLIGMLTTGCGLMGNFKVSFQDKKGNTYETELELTKEGKGVGFGFTSKDGVKYSCSYADKKVINGEDDVVEMICLLAPEEKEKDSTSK